MFEALTANEVRALRNKMRNAYDKVQLISANDQSVSSEISAIEGELREIMHSDEWTRVNAIETLEDNPNVPPHVKRELIDNGAKTELILEIIAESDELQRQHEEMLEQEAVFYFRHGRDITPLASDEMHPDY